MSGWLAVTFVYCVETAKDILKRFSACGSSTIIVFAYEISLCPHQEVGYRNNFQIISRFISEMIQDVECQEEMVCDLSVGAISNDLE